MKNHWKYYTIISLSSFIEQGLVMFSYHYMPKWFFWTTFVMWILSDIGRAIRFSRVETKEVGK